ncbi:uncharacterized protein BDW43DRAFT_136983 [Aspergillus alliaceus]|uniref:uncharacterized protein n=1 Tax=Petromyces alliaceus TaxID=209559 RepID=UPI0012A74F24|nr:uncharacterized protein BDW43DRAFT_136983 [Aspergillus alliaceus]KAB8231441.1 hypothetical protein BDW43DRAFT_136983 [Aspergillus alliaceus]
MYVACVCRIGILCRKGTTVRVCKSTENLLINVVEAGLLYALSWITLTLQTVFRHHIGGSGRHLIHLVLPEPRFKGTVVLWYMRWSCTSGNPRSSRNAGMKEPPQAFLWTATGAEPLPYFYIYIYLCFFPFPSYLNLVSSTKGLRSYRGRTFLETFHSQLSFQHTCICDCHSEK